MSRLQKVTSLLKTSLPSRLTGDQGKTKPPGRLKRMFLWLYNPTVTAAKDYRDVMLETGQKMIKKPIKSTCYMSVLGITSYLWYNNPTLDHFRDASLSNHHRLLMLSWRVR